VLTICQSLTCQEELQEGKHEADTLRKHHLKSLLNEAIVSNKQKKSKALKHLIQAECNKHCYIDFRQHTKPKLSGGLSYVTKQATPESQPTTILDKEKLDDTLLDYSRKHFATAQGTPFTIEPLSQLLQYNGLTPYGDRILHGHDSFDHLPFDEPTRTLLKHMKDKITSELAQQHPLDYASLMNRIKKWPEKTAMLPSGRHLGIYKTLQKHVKEKKRNNDDQMTKQPPLHIQQGQDVLYLIFDIMTLMLHHSYMLN